MSKKQKTNAMRILDKDSINYRIAEYEYDENDLSGTTAAKNIGMKKNFPAFIEHSALNFDEIAVSAGIRGCQIILSPDDLIHFLNCSVFVNN